MARGALIFGIAAAAAAAVVGGVVLARRDADSEFTDDTPQAGTMQLVPSPGDPAMAERVRTVADAIARLWGDATGTDGAPSGAVVEILCAHFWGESGLGNWWHAEMAESNNEGAVQCSMSEQTAGSSQPYYRCADYQDSHPNADGSQTKFAVKFRYYLGTDGRSALDWGVWDAIHLIAAHMPGAFAALQTGDVGAYCTALYDAHYYGGFGATREERIGGYVKMIASHLSAVAAALGHDSVLATVPDTTSGTWTPTAVGV